MAIAAAACIKNFPVFVFNGNGYMADGMQTAGDCLDIEFLELEAGRCDPQYRMKCGIKRAVTHARRGAALCRLR